MKVLFIGDSPTVSTGFARVSRAVCNALHRHGHEVTVLGLHYHGDPHDYPYTILPCYEPFNHGTDSFGVGRLPYVAAEIKPDLVAILNDPWNIKGYFASLDNYNSVTAREQLDFPMIGCLAVDAKNHPCADLNRLHHVITWTEFGAEELARGGYVGESTVIPHGIDDTFYPVDKLESRHQVFGCRDLDSKFIVGVVGRNQPRKRVDLAIEYFADWIKTFGIGDGAWLFLHVAPTGECGVDIKSLVNYYGISGQVALSSPSPHSANSENDMLHLYNSLDVLLSTTQGEGWGLPALEAMACRVPCILPDYSGFGSWARGLAWLVPCYDHGEITAPIGNRPYTIGAIPRKDECVKAINEVYKYSRGKHTNNSIDTLMAAAEHFAKSHPWNVIGDRFVEVFESVTTQSIYHESDLVNV